MTMKQVRRSLSVTKMSTVGVFKLQVDLVTMQLRTTCKCPKTNTIYVKGSIVLVYPPYFSLFGSFSDEWIPAATNDSFLGP